ncbi:MAG TPA: hypothetical protein VFO91_14630, partial [Anaerolineales bacterium]|nr:hypothetical protein [Anaerolineales bacterium]
MWLRDRDTRILWVSLFLLFAATLTFEINLTRLFSVAQFYHFAFMIVSIALLGFGASGTALAVFPALSALSPSGTFSAASPPHTTISSLNADSKSSSLDLDDAGMGYVLQRLSQLAFGTGVSILIAFLLTNWLPFDSFSIAWDPRQVWILILHYVALAAPFFFSGMALGFLLSAFPQSAGVTYAVNLFGSATGCVLALIVPTYLGGEGTVTLSIALAAAASLIPRLRLYRLWRPLLAASALFLFSLFDVGWRFAGRPSFPFLELRISQYKSLSYALQYPGSRVIHRQWNAFSRIDIVRSGGIHSLPGLSYRYLQPLPSLDGLLVDGDDLSPILSPSTDAAFVPYLPNAVAFHLRPGSSALILGPRGGLDVLTALALGSEEVAVTQINPLIVETVPIYQDPRLRVHVESERSYLRRAEATYDVIVLSLTSSFHPVRSGAYTLGEDYRYTVEALRDALAHLSPDGLLVATRWLQDPPSEDLRLFALGITALEENNANPRDQLVAFRGFNTATVLLRNGSFTAEELSSIRAFLGERAFDLTYAPDVRAEETNRYNILPEPKYYLSYASLLNSNPRGAFYEQYEYDVRPPTDDHPFFGHYFKWAQAPQV